MFNSEGLFKDIPCPKGQTCALQNCAFSHDLQKDDQSAYPAPPISNQIRSKGDGKETPIRSGSSHGPLQESGGEKRRRLEDGTKLALGNSSFAQSDVSLGRRRSAAAASAAATAAASLATAESPTTTLAPKGIALSGPSMKDNTISPSSSSLISLSRPVSPPSRLRSNVTPTGAGIKRSQDVRNTSSTTTRPKTQRIELNPRQVSTNPAPHTHRLKILRLLHAEFSRLNKMVATNPDLASSALSDENLIRLALDLEESAAVKNLSTYRNTVTNLLAIQKKSDARAFINTVRSVLKEKGSDLAANGKLPMSESVTPAVSQVPLESGVSLRLELVILKRLVANLAQLSEIDQTNREKASTAGKKSQTGFVIQSPSQEAITAAQAAVHKARNLEVCERCSTHFNVFPDGDEMGKFANRGPCKYHPFRPERESKGVMKYPCCHGDRGSAGCSAALNHVFYPTSPDRLAAVFPWQATPENFGRVQQAVTFDCEMIYTTMGMEVARVSAVSWPSNESILDFLVRPLGHILDANTRWSGITARMLDEALPYDELAPIDGQLRIVSSPTEARSIFWKLISPQTILIGHSIENDLNTLRMIHPRVVDTSLLFPVSTGYPIRKKLKALAQGMLKRKIQDGGAAGHDSMEDSRATGDLVRIRIKNEIRKLQRDGWTISEEAGFVPPDGFVDSEEPLDKFLVVVPRWWERTGAVQDAG